MTPEKCMSMMLKTMAKIAEADQAAPVHDCVLSVSDRAPRPPRRRRRRRRAAAPPQPPTTLRGGSVSWWGRKPKDPLFEIAP